MVLNDIRSNYFYFRKTRLPHDGIAESSDQTLNVLLTESIAKALEVESETTFSTRADIPNSFFVTYHSELLNKFSELLADRGLVTALGSNLMAISENTGFEKLALQNSYLKMV